MITLVLTLIIVGVILYCLNTMLPMDDKIKTLINIVIILCVLVWLAQSFGLLGGGHGVPSLR